MVAAERATDHGRRDHAKAKAEKADKDCSEPLCHTSLQGKRGALRHYFWRSQSCSISLRVHRDDSQDPWLLRTNKQQATSNLEDENFVNRSI